MVENRELTIEDSCLEEQDPEIAELIKKEKQR
jgi:hypothetical protein